MRGPDLTPDTFWYSIDLEALIERDHPLRGIKRMVDGTLRGMNASFRKAYSHRGRPSVAPERRLKAMLLLALYSIRSERELCRRLKTDLPFRWFLDMTPDEDAFVPTVFSKNRERLAEHGFTQQFFAGVVQHAIAAGLASDEHFTVDGSLIQSHASLKSLKRIAREGDVDGSNDDVADVPGCVDAEDFGVKVAVAARYGRETSRCEQNRCSQPHESLKTQKAKKAVLLWNATTHRVIFKGALGVKGSN